MQEQDTKQNSQWLRAFSNSKADIWDARNVAGYDQWYFDALSDDGKEAVRISFLTNDLISSRRRRSSHPGSHSGTSSGLTPSVTFTFFSEGKIKYFATADLRHEDFSADQTTSSCKFGNSKFVYGSADYGAGHSVMLNLPITRDRSIEAHFEWLSVESDLGEDLTENTSSNSWNVVAARSDVTGRISILNKSSKPQEVFHFRGSGYHDHRCGSDPFAESLSEWEWGRVHYADSTATYCRYLPKGSENSASQILIVRDGRIRWLHTTCVSGRTARGRYGIKYPEQLTLTTDENIRLEVTPVSLVASGYNYLAFMSEMTLTLRDGVTRTAVGITETVTSRKIRRGWLERILNFRNGA